MAVGKIRGSGSDGSDSGLEKKLVGYPAPRRGGMGAVDVGESVLATGPWRSKFRPVTAIRPSSQNSAGNISVLSEPPPTGSHAEQLVALMLNYIDEHYHRPMALSDVAAALNMNASYLSSLFSRTAGVTFHKYLEGLRLARAKELLRDPRVRVCDVACAVGYVSPNHFRNVFKAHAGKSPSAWRSLPHPDEPVP
jgi:AraC-like DNA-binding protein